MNPFASPEGRKERDDQMLSLLSPSVRNDLSFPPLHFPYFLTHFYDNSRPFTEISPLSPSPPSPPPASIHTCLCASLMGPPWRGQRIQ